MYCLHKRVIAGVEAIHIDGMLGKNWPTLTMNINDNSIQIVQTVTENIVQIANNIGRDGFEQLESNDIQELFESQDEDLTEMELEEMLNIDFSEEEPTTSTEKKTMTLKNLSEGLRMANDLCDFFIKIDPSMDRSLLFKRKIDQATAEYQSELQDLLKDAKQEKITKFFKPLPKPDN